MKTLLLASLLLAPPLTAHAAEAPAPAAAPAAPAAGSAPAPAPNPETVDISDLENDYWRPNKDELEVVQNRRFEKKGRFEVGVHYGILQGEDFENSKSLGGSLTYNIGNEWFVEASHHHFSNSDNEFLASLAKRFGFRPDFNREVSQTALQVGWTPIYAKFSLLGQKISHFELSVATGAGITKTSQNNFTALFSTGMKFYLTDHFLFRVEWRMATYNDHVPTSTGSSSRANGGPGYLEQRENTHNIIFGLGWMF